MDKKTRFIFWIIILTLIGSIGSWILANKLSLIADEKYIGIIVTTAVFLAGFGIFGIDKKDSVFFVNVKIIITLSFLSIISSFLYLIIQKNIILGRVFFSSSVFSLFITITLILILVWYHDNPFLRESEGVASFN